MFYNFYIFACNYLFIGFDFNVRFTILAFMKKLIKIIVVMGMLNAYYYSLNAQNLVPNFGFEEYDNCPTFGDQIEFCTGWYQYSKDAFPETTPDYYNSCSPLNNMGIPQSYYLYQPDHRSCGAYIALITWSSSFPEYREHVGVQLSQALVIGQKYYLSFYTVMGGYGGSGDTTWYYDIPSNNIGMRLSTVAYSPSSPVPIDNFAHLRSIDIIPDTVNWVRISGSIIADSAYNFLMLGNFYDDANTDTLTQTCGNCINNFSYYLIDDICVSTDSSLCNGGIDALPCLISIDENNSGNPFSIYPNPTTDFVIIQNSFNTSFNLTVYNSIGQLLYSEQVINTDNLLLDVSNYNNKLLFINITTQNNHFMYKLLKQ